MSRFREELRVIPRTAWYLAIVLYLVCATLIFQLVLPNDPGMGKWPLWGRFLFAYGMFFLLCVWILLIGYVYVDAKRRGMRYVMWTWLAILIPNAIGIILFFVLRDPLPKHCPGCGTLVKAGFTFCPHCGTPLEATCPNCGRSVERGWSNCPHCGKKMPSPASGAAQIGGAPS